MVKMFPGRTDGVRIRITKLIGAVVVGTLRDSKDNIGIEALTIVLVRHPVVRDCQDRAGGLTRYIYI